VLPKVAGALASVAAGALAAKDQAAETAHRAPDAFAVLKGEANAKPKRKVGPWILVAALAGAAAAVLVGRRRSVAPDPWAIPVDDPYAAPSAGASGTGASFTDKAAAAAGAAKDKASEVKDAAADKAADVKDAVADKAADVKDAVADKVAGAKDTAADAADGASDAVRDAADTAEGRQTLRRYCAADLEERLAHLLPGWPPDRIHQHREHILPLDVAASLSRSSAAGPRPGAKSGTHAPESAGTASHPRSRAPTRSLTGHAGSGRRKVLTPMIGSEPSCLRCSYSSDSSWILPR
jgi:hypothetical protein